VKRLALLGCMTLAAVLEAQQPAGSPIRKRTLAEDLQLFSQVLNQIRVNHADTSKDMHALLLSAIEGMVQAADPHSYVIPAVRLDSSRRSALMAGKLHPVLVDFQWIDGAPIVAAVAPGTKVSRVDVIVGDELVEIEGQPVAARSPEELMYSLAGPKGSSVRVRFERRRSDGSIGQLDRQLPRERYEDQTAIPVATLLDPQTGYVRVTTFANEKVADDLNGRIEQLEKAGMKQLVLDLRDNGGGSVAQAADVAGAFLPRGSLVYTIAGPKKEMVDTGRVSRVFWRNERRFPVVVMVNSGTASASELVAAALQDHDRALVMGRTTFGKALVMVPVPLSDGSLMVLTVGRVSTPCGRVVQREYRGFSRRHYLRTAGASTDTVGRPSCRTTSGRTVYGGGGVVPDVILPQPYQPIWLTRLRETDALLTWSGGYVSANAAKLTTLEQFTAALPLAAEAIADFRTFAASRGVNIPTDSADTNLLRRSLLRSVAYARWSDEGLYRVTAVTDPDVRVATGAFDRAAAMLKR
jgi:carboxyl-terminal processing protease